MQVLMKTPELEAMAVQPYNTKKFKVKARVKYSEIAPPGLNNVS
jgi:hypothetical protein